MKQFFLFFAAAATLYGWDGTLVDKNSSNPIADAIVSDSKHSVRSDSNGTFSIDTDEKMIHIKAYGYRPATLSQDTNNSVTSLESIRVKALYLTFWGASNNSPRLKKALDLIETTQINAVVVDVKNEYGSTLFWTKFKQANSYGAHLKRTNRDIEKFMKRLKDRNIYTIARIVTFKDELQASNNYEYAIKKNDANKTIWRNHDEMAWVDPYDKRSHEYAIRMAEEAAKVGFDEINFDYVRFPAKEGLCLAEENTQKNRIKAIGNFLDLAQERLRKYGVFISVDIYGNVCWSKDDNGIGQTIESLAKHADYIAPMLYPSGFASGSFGKKYPAKHPYIVIYRSIKHIEDKISPLRIRPWLQYFKDYSRSKVYYKKEEIQAQIKAADETHTNGWMLWSPSSKYDFEILK
ncbi:putative glycoside hydrolase [Sulfurimonas marina]|uniref:GTP-binding protein n=1 Tax=Sulfurimonas marina TaxID=2590551 RepID=A0A7M1AV25_9BACT|nr:putative glycoside hydrolase [Sulfurimonas marina]QOP41279.1 GTP-binding protein [Sulfurimonas marina]